MSKKSKDNKPAAKPAIRPPGQVLRGGYGPQKPVLAETPVDRLRQVLHLSSTCDIEQVCGDAAAEIERLRHRPVQPTEPGVTLSVASTSPSPSRSP